ncbi:MAG: hypothetical protein ACK5HO_15490 [Pseudomonadota bacterium]
MGRKIIWGTTLHPEDNRLVITTDSLSADELRVFSQGFDSRADAAIRALQEVFTARDALLGNPQIKQALEAVRGKCGEINRAAKEQLIKDSEKLLAQWKGASNTAIPGHFFPLDLIRSLPCPDSCLALTSPEWQGALAWFELCFKALDDSREGKSDRLNRWNEVLYKLDECLDLGIESAQACLISELGVSSEDALRLNNIFGAKRTTLFECMFSDLMIAAPVSIEEQLGFPDPVLRGALFDLDPACYQETIRQKWSESKAVLNNYVYTLEELITLDQQMRPPATDCEGESSAEDTQLLNQSSDGIDFDSTYDSHAPTDFEELESGQGYILLSLHRDLDPAAMNQREMLLMPLNQVKQRWGIEGDLNSIIPHSDTGPFSLSSALELQRPDRIDTLCACIARIAGHESFAEVLIYKTDEEPINVAVGSDECLFVHLEQGTSLRVAPNLVDSCTIELSYICFTRQQ